MKTQSRSLREGRNWQRAESWGIYSVIASCVILRLRQAVPELQHHQESIPFWLCSSLFRLVEALLVRLGVLILGVFFKRGAFGGYLEVLTAGLADDAFRSSVLVLSASY